MLERLRESMGPRGRVLIKLTLWSGILTWMVFFFIYGLVASIRLITAGPELFGTDLWGRALTWISPIWLILTVLLLFILVAKYLIKKLKV
jgi:hypothetical protein